MQFMSLLVVVLITSIAVGVEAAWGQGNLCAHLRVSLTLSAQPEKEGRLDRRVLLVLGLG